MFTNKISLVYDDISDRLIDTSEAKAVSFSFHNIFFFSMILSHSEQSLRSLLGKGKDLKKKAWIQLGFLILI